jgi:glycosyltransferase involved in cell wall biosynthesis
MKVSLLLPAKNEIEGLRHYLPAFVREGYHEIVVLDGRSTDGSAAYARSEGCKVIEQEGSGMRTAYMQAFPQLTGDVVIVFSPDGNSVPEAIPVIAAKLAEGYDMVIATRYKDGARSYDDTLLSGIANKIFTAATSLFGFDYTDAMVMYRGFRRSLPSELGLDVRRSNFYESTFGRYVSWEPLMSIRAAKSGIRICEVGFNEPARLDQQGAGLLLPATRINHYKAGIYCLMQLFDEAIHWNWKRNDGGPTQFRRRFP